MTVKQAVETLGQHGIRCRRDWGSTGRWLAEKHPIMYCVGGLDLIGAASTDNPTAYLSAACAD